MKRAAICILAFLALDARAQWLEVNISLTGGRWQTASDASAKLYTRFGNIAADGKLGATHSLYTPTSNQYDYPIGYSGQLTSNLTVTPDAQGALQGGCAYSNIDAYSMDADYPAPPRSLRSTRICWDQRQPQSPGDEVVCPGPGCSSPIILALGRSHYELTSAADGVVFDLRNDGSNQRVAWTEGETSNAFLAMDRNGNGAIDSGAELFGDRTPLADGIAENGFVALARYDLNGDGAIDVEDAIWGSLLLWTDDDHDGRSSARELLPIARSGIERLGLDYRVVNRKDRWGNLFHYMARYELRGHAETFYDIFLRTLP